MLKGLLYGALIFTTLYLGSCVMFYGLMMILCLILILLCTLLMLYLEGIQYREALWSMTRQDRQLLHAKNLNYFTVIPPLPAVGPPQFRVWNESQWRKLAEGQSEQMSAEMSLGKEFTRLVDGCVVRAKQWPTSQEVLARDNTIVINVRGLWAGLVARVNPMLNAFINRYVKCWNRQLLYASIRLASYGLPYPVVTIDFPTADTATINFGQKDDCLVMSYIYEHVRRTYPKAKIILQSVCLGGLRILNWLARNPTAENLIGVVLESPLPSLRHLMRGFLGSCYSESLYRTFCLVVPNFRPELEHKYSFFQPTTATATTTSSTAMAPRTSAADDVDDEVRDDQVCKVPVFVGLIESDPFSNKSHLPLFVDRFPNLTVFATDEQQEPEGHHKISHGKLYRLPAYRAAVHSFITAIQHLQPHPQKSF